MPAEQDAIASRVRRQVNAGRTEFLALIESLSAEEWRQRSRNPAWTNGQLLFHIALGFFLLVPLLPLVRIFAALPRRVSRVFARCLNLATPLFNWINAIGPRLGGFFFNRRRLTAVFERVHVILLRKIDKTRTGDWSRGMDFPTRWEPRFSDFMTFEQIFEYPTIHLRHHQLQVSRGGARSQ